MMVKGKDKPIVTYQFDKDGSEQYDWSSSISSETSSDIAVEISSSTNDIKIQNVRSQIKKNYDLLYQYRINSSSSYASSLFLFFLFDPVLLL